MLVTYTYQSDEVDPSSSSTEPNVSQKKNLDSNAEPEQVNSEIKSFSFWTLINLGNVEPRREETRRRVAGTGTKGAIDKDKEGSGVARMKSIKEDRIESRGAARDSNTDGT
jgi:hypothetical protein